MRRIGYAAVMAAVMALSFGMTAQAATTYKLEITNNYDENESSRDDNDKNKVHPLAPDVELTGSSGMVEMDSDVTWSKKVENWTAGSDVTGTFYVISEKALSKSSIEAEVTNGRNEAEVTSVKKYTGDDYETEDADARVYEVKFTYQIAAKLAQTTWAGWDSAVPTLARWNPVKFANTYRVVLYDDQGSVVTQTVEGETSCDFASFMTKTGVQYYFEVAAVARNGNQQDYLEDGEAVNSLNSAASNPGITDGTWRQYQDGWHYIYADGTAAAGKWEQIQSKWYYFDVKGCAVTGWNQINGVWYYMYDDCSMAAGVTTPDGYQVDASGAWVQ